MEIICLAGTLYPMAKKKQSSQLATFVKKGTYSSHVGLYDMLTCARESSVPVAFGGLGKCIMRLKKLAWREADVSFNASGAM